MLNRPGRSWLFAPTFVLAITASGALTGCGDEEFSDDAYGGLDLAPYFFDGSTASQPNRGLPRNIAPQRGWNEKLRAEYYDFGLLPSGYNRRRTVTGASSDPDSVNVHPMYFFFDSNRRPMFSKPIFEARTGTWSLRGGEKMLNPNPKTYKDPKQDSLSRIVPYSIRVRDTVKDSARGGSSDYQRPIIDRLHSDSAYSGLWEIVEVTATGGYKPDAIKSWKTLEKAIDAGDFTMRQTQKVIDCPVLDDRTYVTPSVFSYGRPTPRIEIWYRTKKGSCYLIHGWETLGDDKNIPYPAANPKTLIADDARRLDTFDVVRAVIGEGAAKRQTVVAPVGKIFIPMVRVANQNPLLTPTDIRYGGDDLSGSVPRRKADDLAGYRPVRWLYDILVAQDPPYVPGTFTDVTSDNVDPTRLVARSGPFLKNQPLIGRAIPCGIEDKCADVGLECNQEPDDDIATADPPVGYKMAEWMQRKEGGPRCDVKAVNYGDFCSPAVARCATKVSDEDAMNFASISGPAPIPANNGYGYTCHPSPTGYCHIRCDSRAPNYKQNNYKDVGGDPAYLKGYTKDVVLRYNLDSRCGGPDGRTLLGFSCNTPTTTPATPTKLRVCARTCSTSKYTDELNNMLCTADTLEVLDVANSTAAKKVFRKSNVEAKFQLNNGVGKINLVQGTICASRNGISSCGWDPAFEPRDDKLRPQKVP